MNRFAELLDRLAYEHGRNNKLRLITDYFRTTPDPERGWALAALTGALSFRHAKPGVIRALDRRADRSGAVRTVLRLCRRPVGDDGADVAEAIRTGATGQHRSVPLPSRRSSTTLGTLGKSELPAQLARWLDALDETGRWALLKLVTGGLRIGVSARLAKTAAAALGDKDAQEIELIWPGLAPPYPTCSPGWKGTATSRPTAIRRRSARRCWRMRSKHADFAALDPADFIAEWKWDGIRVQAVAGVDDRTATRSRGSIRAPARTFPRRFPT